MRIAIVVDSDSWAIGKLAMAKVRHNSHHCFKYLVVHPRDAGEKSIQDKFLKDITEFNPQVIHFEYFRTASQLLTAIPELKKYKIILTHHNQREKKALLSADWEGIGVNKNVTHTEKAKEILIEKGGQKNVNVIKHGVDSNLFTFSDVEPKEFTVGYVGRVVPWKGLKEIAEVCHELKVPLMFMGRKDKDDYWKSIPEEHLVNIDFSFMDCGDSERVNFYRYLSCYVSFSDDGYEEGPLSFFEAMFCGVPVITTPNGTAREFGKSGENCLMVDFQDKEGLKNSIIRMRDDFELRKRLRNNAWDFIKNYHERRMAYDYSKLYSNVAYDGDNLVSVIIPTYNRKEQLLQILDRLKEQTYKNIEIIIANDGSDEENFKEDINNWIKNNTNITIKVVDTDSDILRKAGKEVYGLAKARNMAACEAEGKYLLFLDSRMLPEITVVEDFEFFARSQSSMAGKKKIWYFGNKGSGKSNFVENFSFVERDAFIKFGMFNERITAYGAMSQDIRMRWVKCNDNEFMFLESIMAKEIMSSKKTDKRRKDIIDMKFLLYRLNLLT